MRSTLTAGTNITISGSTISATGGATQAWVTANFVSPLHQGTVGVTQGLSATMTANTFIISVDQNSDRRNLSILQDANNELRNITTNTTGNLLYDNINLYNVECNIVCDVITNTVRIAHYLDNKNSIKAVSLFYYNYFLRISRPSEFWIPFFYFDSDFSTKLVCHAPLGRN